MLGLFIDEKGMMLDLGHSDVMSPILFNIFPKHLPYCRHQAAPQVRGRRKMWLYMAHSLLRDIDILNNVTTRMWSINTIDKGVGGVGGGRGGGGREKFCVGPREES